MFGDHQPELEEEFTEKLLEKGKTGDEDFDSLRQYFTPAFIWSNYDINYDNQNFIDSINSSGFISSNFLGVLLQDIAGLKLTAYNNFLFDLNHDVYAMNAYAYLNTGGKWSAYENEVEPYNTWFSKYSLIEYNAILDPLQNQDLFRIRNKHS